MLFRSRVYLDGVEVGSYDGDLGSVTLTAIGAMPDGTQSCGSVSAARVWANLPSVASWPPTSPPTLEIADGRGAVGTPINAPGTPPPDPTPLEQESAGRLVPVGTIIMWSGNLDKIPAGWHFCDGRTLTNTAGGSQTLPDLRGRMVRGSVSDPGEVGGKGYTFLSEAQMYPHHHEFDIRYISAAGGGSNLAWSPTSDDDYPLATGQTTVVGSGQAVYITPPYYSLAFLAFYPQYEIGRAHV